MSEAHSSLQKVFEKEGKTKIEQCNHPTPEVLNSWQKVLKKEGRDEIKKCNHLTLEVLNSLQKVLKKEGGDKIESCNHPTPEVLNSTQKLLKQKVKMRERNVTILHLRPIVPCRKCFKTEGKYKISKKNDILYIMSIVPCRKCSKKTVKLRLKNVTILHLRFHSSFQNQHDTRVDCYYIMVGGHKGG